LYSVATPPPPTPLDVLAEASTDPTEDAADDALSPDEEEQNKPTTKRKRAPAKSKSLKSVKRVESVKKVTRKGVYMEGRPSLDLVTPSDCKEKGLYDREVKSIEMRVTLIIWRPLTL
jgi:hypothetical protein